MRPARMGQGIVFAIVAAAALTVAPRTVLACGRGGNSGYPYAVGLFGTVGFLTGTPLTVWDLISVDQSDHPSAAYGVVETLLAAPQFLVGVMAVNYYGTSGRFFIAYTVWMGVLMSHGIWTIATAPPRATTTQETGPSTAPARDAPAPLLQMGIGPTYVPVGQLAQPGVGLVGRF